MTDSVNSTNWKANLVSKQMICDKGEITGYNFVINVECGGSMGLVLDVERTMMKDGTERGRPPVGSKYEAMVYIRILRIFSISNDFDTPEALIAGVNNLVSDCMKENLDDDPGVALLVALEDIPRKVAEEFMKLHPEADAQMIEQIAIEVTEEERAKAKAEARAE